MSLGSLERVLAALRKADADERVEIILRVRYCQADASKVGTEVLLSIMWGPGQIVIGNPALLARDDFPILSIESLSSAQVCLCLGFDRTGGQPTVAIRVICGWPCPTRIGPLVRMGLYFRVLVQ